MLRAIRGRVQSLSHYIAMAEHSQGRTTRRRAKRARELAEDLEQVRERLQAYSLKAAASRPVAPKLAAVLVPLFKPEAPPEAGIRVLLTQRSATLTKHQGEVCLPGGKRDPEDVDDVAAALREAHEELGLSPQDVQIIGPLPPFLSKHYLSVTPVPAIVPAERERHAPTPNPAEVAEVFDVPLSLFLSKQHHSSRDIQWQDYSYRIHYFDYERHTIWGLTAAMLIKVARIAYELEPEFQEHSSPDSEYTRFWYDGQRLRVHTLAHAHAARDDGGDDDDRHITSQADLQQQAGGARDDAACPSATAHQPTNEPDTSSAAAAESVSRPGGHQGVKAVNDTTVAGGRTSVVEDGEDAAQVHEGVVDVEELGTSSIGPLPGAGVPSPEPL